MQLIHIDPLWNLFIPYAIGIIVVLVLHRKYSAIFFGFMLLICYLWARIKIGSISIGNTAPFVNRFAEEDLRRGLKILITYYGIGFALLSFGSITEWNWGQRLYEFLRKHDGIQQYTLVCNHIEKRTIRSKYLDVCGDVVWGWLIAIIVIFYSPCLPVIFGEMFVPIVIIVVFQALIIHCLLICAENGVAHQLLANLAGIFLGTIYAIIVFLVFRGLYSQTRPPFLSPRYPLGSTITFFFTTGICFILGLFFGRYLFVNLVKNMALLFYGILIFVPSVIAAYPPVMTFYIGPTSIFNYDYIYYRLILYFCLGISSGCIVVAVRNMLHARKTRCGASGG